MRMTPPAHAVCFCAAALLALPAFAADENIGTAAKPPAATPVPPPITGQVPGNLNIVSVEPGMFSGKSAAPVPPSPMTELMLKRMELLEKKLDLLEARMNQTQKGGK